MNEISVEEAYKLLCVTPESSNDEVTSSFKKLAMKYHPDRNMGKVEWANNIMAKINSAYSIVMEDRFKEKKTSESEAEVASNADFAGKKKADDARKRAEEEERRAREFANELFREKMIKSFVEVRENAKDALYRYFQYKLFSFPVRDRTVNTAIFNDIVKILQRTYHNLIEMSKSTKEEDLVRHFTVFSTMVFNFYRASECLNILDSYSSLVDVEAYRMYHRGDEFLHSSHKEIFYDRHNRGKFMKEESLENALQARRLFKETVISYPGSSWVVESNIKMEYATALLVYVDLFFSEED